MCIEHWRQRGITLIEQIVFIVIVSVGVVGLVSVMNASIRNSADPMLTKQLMAIAESVMSEVIHQPFTWCDPDDAHAATATSNTISTTDINQCHDTAQTTFGPTPATETRNGTAGNVFDNVADYGGWDSTNEGANLTDAAGNNPMTGFSAVVAVANAGTSLGLADNSAALSITVTVTYGAETYSLTGYRFRYAPRY